MGALRVGITVELAIASSNFFIFNNLDTHTHSLSSWLLSLLMYQLLPCQSLFEDVLARHKNISSLLQVPLWLCINAFFELSFTFFFNVVDVSLTTTPTTLNTVSSVTSYLGLHNALPIYYVSHFYQGRSNWLFGHYRTLTNNFILLKKFQIVSDTKYNIWSEIFTHPRISPLDRIRVQGDFWA